MTKYKVCEVIVNRNITPIPLEGKCRQELLIEAELWQSIL